MKSYEFDYASDVNDAARVVEGIRALFCATVAWDASGPNGWPVLRVSQVLHEKSFEAWLVDVGHDPEVVCEVVDPVDADGHIATSINRMEGGK